MSEYPEHIDHIDDFYRSQLADHEIEPPEGLWGKISLGVLETQNPEVKAAAIRFTNTQKYLALLAGAILLISGSLYFYNHEQTVSTSDPATTPVIEQSVEQQHSSSTAETEGTNLKTVSPADQQLKAKSNTPGSTPIINGVPLSDPATSENPSSETKIEQPVVIPVVTEEQKIDSIAEIKTTQKAPKEKVKFKDKYKKDYQDSTHKIFVPGK